MRFPAAGERLVQRAAGEAEGGRSHGGAKNVERGHRDLEALARPGQDLCLVDAAVLQADAPQRMRCDHREAFRHAEPRGIGIDDKGGDSPGARLFAGAREDDVLGGEPGIGDQRLFAVQHVAVSVPAGGRGHRRDVGAARRLAEREGGDALARRRARQVARLLRLGAEQRDCARPQPLHDEAEIGQSRVAGENLPDQAQGPDIEHRLRPAMSRRDAMAQPAAVGKDRDEMPAAGIERRLAHRLDMFQRHDLLPGPIFQRVGERAVLVFEEGPVEETAVGHQSPSKTGRRRLAKAS